MNQTDVDFAIVGAGIAGASVACHLAPHARVLVLEREAQPGYHSTGRSAAMYEPNYGNAQVRALTRASRAFFDAPPAGFADHPLLTPRGALFVASAAQREPLRALHAELRQHAPELRRLGTAEALALVPCLRAEAAVEALLDPEAFDIDVHALHQGFLKGLRRAGGQLVCNAEVLALQREGERWAIDTRAGRFTAEVVVNAAGAWADRLAQAAGLPGIGLVPKRRSAFMFAPGPGMEVHRWPLVIAADESWYIKPDAGQLLGSPANADACEPQDVQPEELDIALGVERIEAATTLQIRRPQRPWAGLRSFVADGGLVGGFDRHLPGFFWVAAQGGYGVQTAPAMGEACAALARGRPLPAHIAAQGLDAAALVPARLEGLSSS